MPSGNLSLSGELRQQQRLTPMQVQLVRMLEMSAPEVEDEVQRALDEMPALEAVPQHETETHDRTEDGDLFTESGADLQRADYSTPDDVPDYLASATYDSPTDRSLIFDAPSRGTSEPFQELPVADDSFSLIDYLKRQIAELPLSEQETAICEYIAGCIDDNGYLTRTTASIADDLAISEGIETTTTEVARLTDTIRSLDPPGIGAVDLRQCLLLQLSRLDDSEAARDADEMVRHYFDLFSKKHYRRIANAMNIDMTRLGHAVEFITHLNPKPASAIADSGSAGKLRHITPDFFVEADANGNLQLSMLNRIPELRVEASFAADEPLPATPEKSADSRSRRLEEARMFIRAKRDDARNFIKILSMRNDTLMKVMSAIVRIQHDFFANDDDDEKIVPMVLRDIGAGTGLDLSVISRAAQGKYVATPHGVYQLKKFFNEKMSDTNDSLTANRVMARIKQAIEAEDADSPLSDQRITELLNAEGFDLARRTVAKYREKLGFPVARLRRSIPGAGAP